MIYGNLAASRSHNVIWLVRVIHFAGINSIPFMCKFIFMMSNLQQKKTSLFTLHQTHFTSINSTLLHFISRSFFQNFCFVALCISNVTYSLVAASEMFVYTTYIGTPQNWCWFFFPFNKVDFNRNYWKKCTTCLYKICNGDWSQRCTHHDDGRKMFIAHSIRWQMALMWKHDFKSINIDSIAYEIYVTF